jgi:FkbH-like protein
MDCFASNSAEHILQKRKKLRRELSLNAHLKPVRIAILGGTTSSEVADLLELLLLAEGFSPTFYQSEYNKFYEDAVLEPEKIKAFKPDLIYIHTHYRNVHRFPSLTCTETEFQKLLGLEFQRFQQIWSSLEQTVGCQIIQNNFEHPPFPMLGSLDAVVCGGQTRYLAELNLQFAKAAADNRKLLIHDLSSLASNLGLKHWFDWPRWFSYKILTTPEGSLAIARSLAAIIGVLLGKVKKCLVLDLDNTLWGGIIGDDGPDRIQIGKETAVAEAYTAFQQYCLSLRERGVLLAVCSKNNEEIAKAGFAHPDSVLKLEHFSAFRANWEPKHENIKAIAEELNLGLDSFVFVDDNPAERAIVAAQLPAVTVPDVGSEVALYPLVIQSGRYFETVSLSKEDLVRADAYAANTARTLQQAKFANYGEYLDSLGMTAEIEPLQPVYLERATQLIGKSNQFNLTTRRYTFAEIEQISLNPGYIALYGKLTDIFGDNGLVSVVIGRLDGEDMHLDLWIMSCRVLKRDMELAMLDSLAERAQWAGAKRMVGYYSRTSKNGMVEDHYTKLGFELVSTAEDGSASTWNLDLKCYASRNTHIQVKRQPPGPIANFASPKWFLATS